MRWFLRLLGALAAVLALAVGLLFLIPSERVAALAAREFEQATGRALSFAGDIRPTLWPPGIRTGPVAIANASWSVEGPMATAEDLRVSVALWPLLAGEVRLTQVRVFAPQVLLERDRDRRLNWEMGGRDRLSLARLSVVDGTVTFIDRPAAARHALTDLQADLAMPDPGGPGRLDVETRVEGLPLTLRLEVAEAGSFMAGGVVPLTLDASGHGFSLSFAGRGGLAPLAAEGKIALALDDAGRLGPALGLPPPLAAVPLSLTGEATWTKERSAHLRAGRLTLAGTGIEAAADLVTAGPRPRLEAELAAPVLDLGAFLPAGPRPDAWSTAPIPQGWLHPVDAEVLLNAGRLILGPAESGVVETGPVRLLGTLERGRGVIELREFHIWNGEMTGQLVMNARDGLSMGVDLRAMGLDLAQMTTALTGSARLWGEGEGELRAIGSGNTLAAQMNSLSGQGKFRLSGGGISGIDLAGALQRGEAGSGAGTPFDSLSAGFRIADGVLTSEDLSLSTGALTTTGRGMIGIGPRTLNIRLEPAASAAAAGRLRVPVLISGTWGAPRVRLGVQSATDEAIARERIRLEAQ